MPTSNLSLSALLVSDEMQLGGVTLDESPASLSVPVKRRSAASIDTFNGMQFFSWGLFIAGVQVSLKWNYMDPTQFSALETLYEADSEIVWKPYPTSAVFYNVQIMNLSGEYFIYITTEASYRKNVSLDLLIVSEV